MKAIALALGTVAAALAAPVFAQAAVDAPTAYQRELERRAMLSDVPPDRWHLSPPGERPWYEEPSTDGRFTTPDSARFGYGYGPNAYGYRRDERVTRRWDNTECWNPRARHYEAVRPGERQDDLDFSRCRRER